MPWRTITRTLGGAAGKPLGSLLAAVRAAVGGGRPDSQATSRSAFTAAVIGLSAKLAKSDGVALSIEADTFEKYFPVAPEEVENVRRLFRLAAQDVAGFESYARRIARSLENEPDLKRDVFDGLLHIASADGILHPGEDRYLAAVAGYFGYSPQDYIGLRARFVSDAEDPYVILGATRQMTTADLKARYLRLVRELHPDALAGKGHARELTEVAGRKLAAVNAAWAEIAKERGL